MKLAQKIIENKIEEAKSAKELSSMISKLHDEMYKTLHASKKDLGITLHHEVEGMIAKAFRAKDGLFTAVDRLENADKK